MRTVVSSLVLVALLGACGYKGPLYLPQPKPEATPATSSPPADDTKKAKEAP